MVGCYQFCIYKKEVLKPKKNTNYQFLYLSFLYNTVVRISYYNIPRNNIENNDNVMAAFTPYSNLHSNIHNLIYLLKNTLLSNKSSILTCDEEFPGFSPTRKYNAVTSS